LGGSGRNQLVVHLSSLSFPPKEFPIRRYRRLLTLALGVFVIGADTSSWPGFLQDLDVSIAATGQVITVWLSPMDS
jgi:hypothetical protein